MYSIASDFEVKKQIEELEKELDLVDEKRQNIQQNKENKEERLSNIEDGKLSIDAEIEKLDEQMTRVSQNLRVKSEEIRNLEAIISNRDKLLKERARVMYQKGDTSYIEVLLGSTSFLDFIDRLSVIALIAQQDRQLLDSYMEDMRKVEKVKNEFEILKHELERIQQQKTEILKMLVEREEQLHNELDFLQDEDQLLAAQEVAIKQELEANKKRLTTSKFIRPATGSITSTFGSRWASFHYGIDIGKNGRSEDVPIVAVGGGTVIRSYYSASYGNVVFLSHNINGKVMTTVYAHLENRAVSDGERVERGEFLGYMGNTGRSFGAHLHFEVHEGAWNIDKTNAVDPLLYIGK